MVLCVICGLAVIGVPALRASQAYGSINNFDVVNDTNVVCHGFEIELDDIHSKDITYTFDWNHYGVPKITEDNTNPAHPKVFVRYQSGKDTLGAWTAFTAVPAAPIAPTQGHQFTNPSVNFGGEHFGVGFSAIPTNILYHWQVDDGSGNLINGPAVSIVTPTFAAVPPAVVGAPVQIQAAIVPPPAPVPPPVVLEFGHASWVKEIRTTTHNNNEVQLRDLVSPDAAFPGVKNWANGEPSEVEAEWQVLQFDSGAANGGANGQLLGAPEPLVQSDDVITRRYECYEYVGPVDAQTGEALAQTVGPDGVHGVSGGVTDYSQTIIVGKFLGAQMAAADAAAPVGLIDHVQDGEVGVAYPDRSLVVAGGALFTTTLTGSVPAGMTFDYVTGVLSGTPLIAGVSTFTITATDNVHPVVKQTYSLNVAAPGGVVAPHSVIAISASPANAGTVSGGGDLPNGQNATVIATPNPGYTFSNWSESGVSLSLAPSYTLAVDANHTLVANFAAIPVKSSQTITFPAIPTHQVTDGTVLLNATASSGLAVGYKVLSGPATVAGNILTLTGVGTVQVQADQPGDASYLKAPSVTTTFSVTKGTQTISFPDIGTHNLAEGTVQLNASASSALPVGYIVVSGPAKIAGNILKLNGSGTVTIRAYQSGNNLYVSAPTVTNSFVVLKKSQTINFPAVAGHRRKGGTFALNAAASSGLPVTFRVLQGPGIVVGNVMIPTGVGIITVQATQSGNSSYAPAPAANQKIAITQ
jgi:hypothetical protein